MGRLSASAVKAAIRPGRVGDGDGLYLVIKPGGAKSWVCRVQRHGNRRDFGFAILTAVRSGEVRAATWDEIDLESGLWTIAASRMKANREHVVPLTEPALRIMKRCAELRQPSSNLLFPGMKRGAPLSDMTLSKLMKEMGELYRREKATMSFAGQAIPIYWYTSQ